MQRQYVYDPASRVWRCSQHAEFNYSDGDSSEEYLREVIDNARDLSTYSPELIAAIRDWPSEYHLSPLRHNLLRPFAFEPTAEVLELGAGCGAMTRYLGEHCAKVISVEGSPRRAQIAASRCRDLDNVAVYCDSIDAFQTDAKFDYVFLVGVLEYASQFGQEPAPAAACLKRAAALLKPGGRVVIAIENKLGLKYFAGCAEDHHGIPFLGVGDLYPPRGATTFGRRELGRLLCQAQLESQAFYYPFPDYKLPTVMLSEGALSTPGLNVPDLLLNAPSRDYHDDSFRCFDEGLAWRAIHANGLVGDFANSFLIFAGRDETGARPSWLARLYNRMPRQRRLAVETTLAIASDDRIDVLKRRLFPDEATGTDSNLGHAPDSSVYLRGELLLNRIREAMAREAEFTDVAASFEPWISLLKRNARPGSDGRPVVPGHFADCVPFNLLQDTAGELHYFDVEWIHGEHIPLSWVFIRGAMYSITGAMLNRHLAGMDHRRFINKLAAIHGIALDEQDFGQAATLEARFVSQVSANPNASLDLTSIYDQLLYTHGRYRKTDENEAARVKSTVSWRITAPLRAMWNLPRSFVRRLSSRSARQRQL